MRTGCFSSVRPLITAALAGMGAMGIAPERAGAQCATSLESLGSPGVALAQGLSSYAVGATYCSTRWDPDGAGPLSPWLIVGGNFTSIDGVAASNIAAWDGERWRPLGPGLGTQTDPVYALTVFNGDLVAGGRFLRVGGTNGTIVNCIARWDGAVWLPFATGLANGSPTTVAALAVHNGELYAGGSFYPQGAFNQKNVARWSGTQWLPVFTGLGSSTSTSSAVFAPVLALHVHEGLLYAAGSFAPQVPQAQPVSIARLVPGSGWTTVGGGLGTSTNNTVIYDLETDGGDLLAVGTMTVGGGPTGGQVARFDGTSWTSLASPSGLAPTSVARLGSDLIVGMNQTLRLYRINAGALEPIGSTMSEPGSPNPARTVVLGSDPHGLLIGGNFMRTDTLELDWRFLNSLAVWDGANYSPLSRAPDRAICDLTRYNGDLYAIGTFLYADNVPVNRVAKKAGPLWLPLGDGSGLNGRAFSGVVWNGKLAVGGTFTTAGGQPANHVAAWNGTAWEAIGAGVPEAAVRGVFNFNGELLAVCGNIVRITDIFVPTLRRWNGTDWVLFGDADGTDANVGGVFIHNNELYTSLRGGVQGSSRWNGSDWVPVMDPNPPINIVGVWQGNLLGVGQGATHRFVNGAWELIAAGMPNVVMTYDSIEFQGEFYLGGQNGTQTPGYSRWNGAAWLPVNNLSYNPPGTVGSHVAAFAEDNGSLLIAGALGMVFNTGNTGYQAIPTHALSSFAGPSAPVFTSVTDDLAMEPSAGGFVLTAQVLNAQGAAYSWRRNGEVLVNGLQADLSTVTGADTPALTVTSAATSQSAYTLRVTVPGATFCGSTSPPITVTVGAGCDTADFNRDWLFPDTLDITDLLSVFAGGACSNDPPQGTGCGDIDFNNDGLFPDVLDIQALLSVFSGGPCVL